LDKPYGFGFRARARLLGLTSVVLIILLDSSSTLCVWRQLRLTPGKWSLQIERTSAEPHCTRGGRSGNTVVSISAAPRSHTNASRGNHSGCDVQGPRLRGSPCAQVGVCFREGTLRARPARIRRRKCARHVAHLAIAARARTAKAVAIKGSSSFTKFSGFDQDPSGRRVRSKESDTREPAWIRSATKTCVLADA
jgi:hypothetical protein